LGAIRKPEIGAPGASEKAMRRWRLRFGCGTVLLVYLLTACALAETPQAIPPPKPSRKEAAPTVRKVQKLKEKTARVLKSRDRRRPKVPPKKLPAKPADIDALFSRAVVARKRADWKAAIALLERAVAINPRFGEAFNDLGVARFHLGRTAEAREAFERALRIFQKKRDRQGVGWSRANLAALAQREHRYSEAMRLYRESLSSFRRRADESNVAAGLTNMGLIHEARGEYGPAERLHREALTRSLRLGDAWGVATALNNLGNALTQQGKYREALTHYEKSRGIALRLGDRRLGAKSLSNQALVQESLGRIGEALRLHRAALGVFEDVGDERRPPGASTTSRICTRPGDGGSGRPGFTKGPWPLSGASAMRAASPCR
jgi:tetratricopeptide (TPR) repeat protein